MALAVVLVLIVGGVVVLMVPETWPADALGTLVRRPFACEVSGIILCMCWRHSESLGSFSCVDVIHLLHSISFPRISPGALILSRCRSSLLQDLWQSHCLRELLAPAGGEGRRARWKRAMR